MGLATVLEAGLGKKKWHSWAGSDIFRGGCWRAEWGMFSDWA